MRRLLMCSLLYTLCVMTVHPSDLRGFQFFGEAIPGSTLRACGYPTYGTSLCIFEWVRHHYNGTPQYVEAATNPEYVVTADDVGATISAKCIPMDDKGNQATLFLAGRTCWQIHYPSLAGIQGKTSWTSNAKVL
ncbi:hypothetical protein QJS10_CPA01g03010 [Acorus calamus]|uniref:AIR9-like A9 domain-containing protein n=1 Tax=Acorus calamus TaxID=4465 RepID=A0AAV9FLZ3_ACOCL|nr:hypothetical protein QJS10_CPA01g03010 [Acorus calamus]